MKQKPLDRIFFDAADLMKNHPPRWRHQNKQTIFDMVRSANYPFEGQIIYARWPEMQIPQTVAARSLFQVCPGVFTYTSTSNKESEAVEWHMNFADPHLFVAYGSSLLAQDELQVAEHPILGALREALVSMGKPAETVDPGDKPTPVTISGVQRHCVFDTRPDPAAGRFHSLYGNAFARAPLEEIVAATRVLNPPTISNILAMAAPACGYGTYTRKTIGSVLSTAYTGYLSARRASEDLSPTPSRTVIHTGFWGCGAFGGNRILMTILQALAADLADIDLVFHALDDAGVSLAEDAYKLYRNTRNSTSSVSQILDALVQQSFEWGVSDGN